MRLRDDLCGGEEERTYSQGSTVESVRVCVCGGEPIDWVDWIKREEVGLYRFQNSHGSDLELGVCSAFEQRNSVLLT